MKHYNLIKIAEDITSFKPENIDSYIQGVIHYDPPLSSQDENEFNQLFSTLQSIKNNFFMINDKNVQHNLNYLFEHFGIETKLTSEQWLPIYTTFFYRKLNLLAKDGSIYFFFDYQLTTSHLLPAITLISDIHNLYYGSKPSPLRHLFNETSFTTKNTPMFFANIVNKTFDVQQFVFSNDLNTIAKASFGINFISKFSVLAMDQFFSYIHTSPSKSVDNLARHFDDKFFNSNKTPYKKEFKEFIKKLEIYDYTQYQYQNKASSETMNVYREIALSNLLRYQKKISQNNISKKKI